MSIIPMILQGEFQRLRIFDSAILMEYFWFNFAKFVCYETRVLGQKNEIN